MANEQKETKQVKAQSEQTETRAQKATAVELPLIGTKDDGG